jgi:hypothetical protein
MNVYKVITREAFTDNETDGEIEEESQTSTAIISLASLLGLLLNLRQTQFLKLL